MDETEIIGNNSVFWEKDARYIIDGQEIMGEVLIAATEH